MGPRILPAAMLLSLSLIVSVVGQTQSELSTGSVATADHEPIVDVIHLPSPFAEPSQPTVSRGVPMENHWRSFRRVPDHEESPADAIGQKQFVIESWTLGVDATTADEILNLVDAETFQVADDVITAGTIPSQAGNGEIAGGNQNNGSIAISSPTTHGQITEAQFSQIREMMESLTDNNISKSPRLTVHENQLGTISDAAAAPFMVSTQPAPDGRGGFKNVPRVQPIEFGIIARHRVNMTETGIWLESKIILNEIYDVDTYTLDGGGSSVTIQVPRCYCKQLSVSQELEEGKLLLIDPNYSAQQIMRNGQASGFFKNPLTGNEYAKMLFVIKATVIK